MSDTAEGQRPGPLSGIRVIDLTSVVLGTFATQILGDLGADVIKIEAPGGDGPGGDIMRWGGATPEGAPAGMGPLFLTYNRNKRSIALDLKTDAGRHAMQALIATADLFASNVRMAGLERMGLAYDDVRGLKPDIVYVHASGFGRDGPYAGLPAYDDLIQAASGSADLLPRTDGDGRPRYFPALVADKSVGLYMVYAALAALYQRARTGEGQFVEVPMLECFTHYTMSENLYGHVFDPPAGDYGYGRILNPDRRPYRTRDGWIGLTPYSDRNWRDFFEAAGRLESFLSDKRFNAYEARIRNIRALYALVEEITVEKTTGEWIALLRPRNVPCCRVHRLDTIMDDEHLAAVGFFARRDHPDLGTMVDIRHPVSFSQAETGTRTLPPRLGQHTSEVLREAGLDDDEIAALGDQGAFGREPPAR